MRHDAIPPATSKGAVVMPSAEAAATSSTPTLAVELLQAAEAGEAWGAYEHKVKWKITNPRGPGFIVQHVVEELEVKGADGKAFSKSKIDTAINGTFNRTDWLDYYELWVLNAKGAVQHQTTANSDLFAAAAMPEIDGARTSGRTKKTGVAWIWVTDIKLADLTKEAAVARRTPAGILPAWQTGSLPASLETKSSAATVTHGVEVTWDAKGATTIVSQTPSG